MQKVLPLGSTLIAALLPFLSISQESLDRHTFLSMAMVVTDQERFSQAFMGSADHAGPVLWVRIPSEITDISSGEVIERKGRHGLVVIAHETHLLFHNVPLQLVFRDLSTDAGGYTAHFRTHGHVDAAANIPMIKGNVWFPMFDGSGPARVEFQEASGREKRQGRARLRLRAR